MWKQIFGVLTIALFATGCGSSGGRELSAAEPPADAAAQASQRQPATEQTKSATRMGEAVSRPAARTTSPQPAYTRNGAAVPVYREFTLPVGTTLPVELTTTVASDVSEVENTVRATLRHAVTVDGQEVLPTGTELAGHVTEAERSGRVKGRARVGFRFTSLRYDDERIPVRTDPIAQKAEATKGEDATKIGIGAGAGAVIGAVVGGKSGAAKSRSHLKRLSPSRPNRGEPHVKRQ